MVKIQNLVLQNIQLENNKEKKLIPLQFTILDKLKISEKKNKGKGFVFVFDEVGCGKTVEAVIVVWDTIVSGRNKVLIVCPSNLVFNWYEELLLKFGFDFKIISGIKESKDIYHSNCGREVINGISNLCIITYDSRNSDKSNAALDCLKKFDLNWDLIILDEGHDSKEEATNRYESLKLLKSSRVMFLSATPIKTESYNLDSELNLVSKILDNEDIKKNTNFNPQEFIRFNLDVPISRNFKEIMREKDKFRDREVIPIPYKIEFEHQEDIRKYYTGSSLERNLGCIFLFKKIFYINEKEKYKVYKKYKYDQNDVDLLSKFDKKLECLVQKISEILNEDQENKIVIFCNHREVVEYLKKVLSISFSSYGVEGMHGDTYEKEERKKIISLFDKSNNEMEKKRILILSHKIGVVGINLSKFNHLINYELPDTPADLEQRFGRIDRVTNLDKFQVLKMYYFKDENSYFDSKHYRRILGRFNSEVLPLLPSKNLFNTSKTYVDFVNDTRQLYLQLENKEQQEISDENKEEIKMLGFKNKSDMNNFLNTFYELIEYKAEDDNFIQKAETYCCKKLINIVEYGFSNTRNKFTYNELRQLYLNHDYIEYKSEIKKIDDDILMMKNEINEVDDIIGHIMQRIREDNINSNMIFTILYNVWIALEDKTKFNNKFENFIYKFNEGRC